MAKVPMLRLAESTGEIPVLGLGTWQLTGKQGHDAVTAALEIGYRHIDTATAYGNEEQVGAAIRESGIPRSEIFVTTKLPPERAQQARRVLDESLRKLDTEYVDLWLIHWPVNGTASPQTWQELLKAREEGLARAVGVSNYSPAQVDELAESTGVRPAVNQIPWAPPSYDHKLVDYHRENDVVLEGYSPFKRSDLASPVLREIAEAHGKSPAQVVLRWHVDHDIVVIPKSAKPERLRSNFDIWDFSLDDDEVRRIDALTS